MKQREHPRFAEFAAWCAKHASKAKPLTGEFYRVAGPRHTTAKAIVSGIGAFAGGGRWNSPGVMRIVYTSVEPETALREANEHFRYGNMPISKGLPKVIVAFAVTLERVLDFTDATLASVMPESMSSLLAEDWRALMARGEMSSSQAMGRAAFEAGLQGLIVPSKPDPTGVNLLIFPERLTRKCRLKVLNAAELDKLGKAV